MKWIFNALRCQMLLRANGLDFKYREVLKMIWAFDFASESSPGGVGGPIAGFAMLRARQVPSTVISSLVLLILLLDMVAITCLLSWALTESTLVTTGNFYGAMTKALMALIAVLVALECMFRFRHRIIRALRNRLHTPSRLGPWFRATAKALLRTGRALEKTRGQPPSRLAMIFLASLGYWACRLSALYFVILALGFNTAWADALFIQFVAGISGMLLGLPGGYVGADIAITTLLIPALEIKTIAAALLLWRLLTFHLTLAVGGLAFALEMFKMSRDEAVQAHIPHPDSKPAGARPLRGPHGVDTAD
ncbi:MAG: hypothetical protein K0R03_90 [Moraxellaceae bacterium]|jgi:uncharacterized protein (TIRG00374 family)|nr:hypothetical protein [Moraxellaceae bacterium]